MTQPDQDQARRVALFVDLLSLAALLAGFRDRTRALAGDHAEPAALDAWASRPVPDAVSDLAGSDYILIARGIAMRSGRLGSEEVSWLGTIASAVRAHVDEGARLAQPSPFAGEVATLASIIGRHVERVEDALEAPGAEGAA